MMLSCLHWARRSFVEPCTRLVVFQGVNAVRGVQPFNSIDPKGQYGLVRFKKSEIGDFVMPVGREYLTFVLSFYASFADIAKNNVGWILDGLARRWCSCAFLVGFQGNPKDRENRCRDAQDQNNCRVHSDPFNTLKSGIFAGFSIKRKLGPSRAPAREGARLAAAE